MASIHEYILAAPFYKYLKALQDGSLSSLYPKILSFYLHEPMYSFFPSLSRSYIIPKPTSVSIVFSINETDDTDRSLMQVFLLEFSEAKRTVVGSPSVTFARDEPNDLHGMVKEKPSVGFLSFGMGFDGRGMDYSLQRRKCGGKARREGRGAAQLLPLLFGLSCEVE